MKKRIIAIVSIVLAVLIALGVILLCVSSCDDEGGKKKVIQQIVVTDKDDKEDGEKDEEPDEDDVDDTLANDDLGTDLGYKGDTVIDLATEFDVTTDVFTLHSKNGGEPLCDTFHGFTGTVYWPTEFTGDEVNGRYYTDEMIDAELSRMRDAGFQRIRLYIYSTWMYTGDFNNPWDWNCDRMQKIYEFIRVVKSYGIEPMVVIGSSMAKAVYGGDTYTPDCYYLYPRELDENGNPIVVNKWGIYFEQIDYELQWQRYGEFAAGLVGALKANDAEVKHYILFTEPHEDGGSPTGAHGEQHLGCFKAIHQALKDAGLRDGIKLYGPNQGNTSGNIGLAKLFMQEAPEVFDVYTSHYAFYGQTSTDDVYEANYNLYSKYMEPMSDYNIDKEFWVDEFDLEGDHYLPDDEGDTFMGTHHADVMVAMMNAGISGFNAWQAIDQVWPFYYGSGGAFKNGAQVIGAARSLYENEKPYPNWYAVTLFSKYLSGPSEQLGKTYYSYADDENCGLHVATVELPEGGWSVVVVNMSTDERTFNLDFEKALNTTLYRYLYSPGEIELTVSAKVITADKGFTNVKNELSDTLAGGAVAVYSTRKNFK